MGQVRWIPEWHLLLIWVTSLAVMIGVSNSVFGGSAVDNAGIVGMCLCCLPLLSPWWTSSGLLILGFIVTSVILGIQVIDLCFDFLILRDATSSTEGSHLSNDIRSVPARRIAWLYYHTVTTAPHVNATVVFLCLLLFLGALACISRSTPEERRIWAFLVLMMCAGNGSYVFVIVPHYVSIRTETTYDPAFFNGWGTVVAARAASIMTIFFAWPVMASLFQKQKSS